MEQHSVMGGEVAEAVTIAEFAARARRDGYALCIVDTGAVANHAGHPLSVLGGAPQPLMVLGSRASAVGTTGFTGRRVIAYVVKPVDTPQLIPSVLAAAGCGAEIIALRELADRRKHWDEPRRAVDVVTGLLMVQRGIDVRAPAAETASAVRTVDARRCSASRSGSIGQTTAGVAGSCSALGGLQRRDGNDRVPPGGLGRVQGSIGARDEFPPWNGRRGVQRGDADRHRHRRAEAVRHRD
jgi:AmiR/NasT family two-component response regulator